MVKAKSDSEAWPAGEEGTPDQPRPRMLPLNKPGVEYDPRGTPGDLAGEVLHVDPRANAVRGQLIKTLRPGQVQYMSQAWNDFGSDPDATLERKIQNATDAAMRGYLVGQAPEEVNRGMAYSPTQIRLLEGLKGYMKTPQGNGINGR